MLELQPHAELSARIEAAVAAEVEVCAPVDRGASTIGRWIVTTTSAESFFVKAGLDQQGAERLRSEQDVYTAVSAPFMPELAAWDDDGVEPLLILEDLRQADWPPPWSEEQVAGVREMLSSIWELDVVTDKRLSDLTALSDLCWRSVAMDPKPFLSLRLCSRSWLEQALPMLLNCEQWVDFDGDEAFLHMDVRSGNICFTSDGQPKIVDWHLACRGNSKVDLGMWLPSLHADGGPKPEELLPDESAEIAALVSGYFAANAGLPPSSPAEAEVRAAQLVQLRSALPWAVRALELTEPE